MKTKDEAQKSIESLVDAYNTEDRMARAENLMDALEHSMNVVGTITPSNPASQIGDMATDVGKLCAQYFNGGWGRIEGIMEQIEKK